MHTYMEYSYTACNVPSMCVPSNVTFIYLIYLEVRLIEGINLICDTIYQDN